MEKSGNMYRLSNNEEFMAVLGAIRDRPPIACRGGIAQVQVELPEGPNGEEAEVSLHWGLSLDATGIYYIFGKATFESAVYTVPTQK